MPKSSRDHGVPAAEFAAAVFEKHGLTSSGSRSGTQIPTDESRPDAAAVGLCESLSELGGLYVAFARFLGWRADLLRAPFVACLRRLRPELPAIPRSEMAALLSREMGPSAGEVASSLSGAPVWNTPFRTAYLGTYRYQKVFVEAAKEPVAEEGLLEFEKGVRAIRHPDLSAIVKPALLEQFREYLRSGESPARERSFLDVLAHHRGETLAHYPAPIPELCSGRILCWPAAEGRPVEERIAQGDSTAAVLVASALMEQFFALSMVEADLDGDAMVVDAEGRLHFRRLSNPVAVLPGVIDMGMKYIASVVAGNAPRSAQTLVRLLIAQPPLDMEKNLMEEFSGVEPELKINMWFPPSAEHFESNWRALAKIAPSRPLFVDCLHRNLLAAGYWTSDAAAAGGARVDSISEAMWPAISQLLKSQFGALLSREQIQEWALGSGMLFISTLREMNRSLEEMRENDITVGVDCSDWRGEPRRSPARAYPAMLAVLLAVFLVCLQWGPSAPEPWPLVLKIAAAGSLAAMFWVVSRIR